MLNPKQGLAQWLPWLVILSLIGVAAILWQPILILFSQPDTALVQAEVNRLGIWGPFGLFALSVIQIVGAPIPGYPVQLLGGALFGTWLGGIYNVVGMTAGGLISAWLVRTLGRPFIERQVNPELLARYEHVAKLESLWVWVIILTIPLGDFPYYLAGLSRVNYLTLVGAILISRGPFTFVISWVGATSLQAPAWLFWVIVGGVIGIVIVGYLLRDRITPWLDRVVLR